MENIPTHFLVNCLNDFRTSERFDFHYRFSVLILPQDNLELFVTSTGMSSKRGVKRKEKYLRHLFRNSCYNSESNQSRQDSTSSIHLVYTYIFSLCKGSWIRHFLTLNWFELYQLYYKSWTIMSSACCLTAISTWKSWWLILRAKHGLFVTWMEKWINYNWNSLLMDGVMASSISCRMWVI